MSIHDTTFLNECIVQLKASWAMDEAIDEALCYYPEKAHFELIEQISQDPQREIFCNNICRLMDKHVFAKVFGGPPDSSAEVFHTFKRSLKYSYHWEESYLDIVQFLMSRKLTFENQDKKPVLKAVRTKLLQALSGEVLPSVFTILELYKQFAGLSTVEVVQKVEKSTKSQEKV